MTEFYKNRRAGLAAFVLWVAASAAPAQFIYITNFPETTLTIVGYTGTESVVAIPDNIAGLAVVGIGTAAFQHQTNLTAVAFPTGILSIAQAAFNGCDGLTDVEIASGTTNIGEGAFTQCEGLATISVSAANTAFCASNGVLFDLAKTTLFQCPAGKSGDYVVPAGVTRIMPLAFAGCTHLTSIQLADSVTEIGFAAFTKCDGLTSLAIPSGVTNLGPVTIFFCTNLTDLYFCGNAPGAVLSALTNGNQGTVHYLPGATGWPTVPDPWGDWPTALWLPVMQDDGRLGSQGEPFGFTASWAPGKTVVVDACSHLTSPDWAPLQTGVLAGGTAAFGDPQWTNHPNRFYRLRAP